MNIYASSIDFLHNQSQIQYRLYIPLNGVLGFRSESQIDFFDEVDATNDLGNLLKARDQTNDENNGIRYLKQIELTEDIVRDLKLSSKLFRNIQQRFQSAAASLIKLVNE